MHEEGRPDPAARFVLILIALAQALERRQGRPLWAPLSVPRQGPRAQRALECLRTLM